MPAQILSQLIRSFRLRYAFNYFIYSQHLHRVHCQLFRVSSFLHILCFFDQFHYHFYICLKSIFLPGFTINMQNKKNKKNVISVIIFPSCILNWIHKSVYLRVEIVLKPRALVSFSLQCAFDSLWHAVPLHFTTNIYTDKVSCFIYFEKIFFKYLSCKLHFFLGHYSESLADHFCSSIFLVEIY